MKVVKNCCEKLHETGLCSVWFSRREVQKLHEGLKVVSPVLENRSSHIRYLCLKLWSVKGDSVISRWKRDGVLDMPFE